MSDPNCLKADCVKRDYEPPKNTIRKTLILYEKS